MSPIAVTCLVFACVSGSALFALLVGRALPEHHLTGDSKDAVKQGLALIATLTALVLGLLVASAKGTYDAQGGAVKQMSANVILLDRVLARYGPETKEARALFRHAMTLTLELIFPENNGRPADPTPGEARAEFEAFYEMLAELTPKNDAQRAMKSRALDLTTDLAQTRLRMLAQSESSIPMPFLIVLVAWLAVLFAGLGLLAPRNATVIAVIIVCILSVSGALFLILELDKPFEGIMQVSSTAFRNALARIGE